MPKHHRIMCPVDLSDNSFAAIELATTLAKQHDSKIAFYYVSNLWDPGKSSGLQDFAKEMIEKEKAQLYKVRPADSSVEFEHEFLHGNAGPELVKASKNADLAVMTTHGRSGIARFIMGSVATYVLRNSKCPVILVKGLEINKQEGQDESLSPESQVYVTEIMHVVPPIHSFESMDSVLKALTKARETAAPVVNGSGKCIGILTTTDIEHFHSLQKRFDEKDETVIEEMFEVDKYGQRKASNYNFDQVERHMTKEVVSLRDTDSVQTSIDLFEAHPEIHHLVVLDEADHPVGIVDVLNAVVKSSATVEKSST